MYEQQDRQARPVARVLIGNHSRAVARMVIVGNHSRAVARALTENHSRAVAAGRV